MQGSVRSRDAWNREFSRRGRRFGGAPPDLPALFQGAIVLEAGCGDGKTLTAMVSRPWQILAIDFSIEAIKISVSSPVLREVSYLIADAGKLPVRENSIDAVFLSHITGHAPESERMAIASEAFRTLKKGGRLFFRDFSRDDFRAGTGTLVEDNTWIRGDGIRTHYFTITEVQDLFSDLIPVSIREVGWFLRVRKKRLRRMEIIAEFCKEQAHAGKGEEAKSAVLISHPSN